jgi:hypothetical protein
MSEDRSFIDGFVEDFSRHVAGGSTRRSLLGRSTKLLLGLLGIKVLPLRLVDARTTASGSNCSNAQYCGIHGIPCASCTTGSDTACPTGSTQGTDYWSACCETNEYEYYDCCARTNNPHLCGSECIGADDCDPGGTAWCSVGKYWCTLAVFLTDC